ncbi:16S rRNA (guanine(966)-N(2))-methyltransferase RsmD [Tropheryma whipplei]|uniref:16S rRNA (guanine(966)-N(2))-methyltransferase RsmD n=1 Tax=Tropheryma whipplei TaxID=2039 RepID=UPI0004BC5D18|nr:16S rRNA (guanine(966)-N(2))-methyltransferase RsmD [Tropheryma whipplei]
MRIIAGFAKSIKLEAPTRGIRPTTERVRESLMSSLQARMLLKDAVVIDCFAGTGALGLEAVSRGARVLHLIDKSAKAFKACKKNADRVKAFCEHAQIHVHKANVTTFLKSSLQHTTRASLVFLDPPYDYPPHKLEEMFIHLLHWINEDTVVILETDRANGTPPVGDALKVTEQKQYGHSVVWWMSQP